jgi:hypothetical protein
MKVAFNPKTDNIELSVSMRMGIPVYRIILGVPAIKHRTTWYYCRYRGVAKLM